MFAVAFGFVDLLSLEPVIMRCIGAVRVTLNTRGFSAAYCGLLASCSILSYGGGRTTGKDDFAKERGMFFLFA